MVKDNMANVIIHDLSRKMRVQDGVYVNSGVISDIVEGWNQNVYVVPNKAIKINRTEPKKYILM